MATQNRNKMRSEVPSDTAHAVTTARKWVNHEEPVVKFLLDKKQRKSSPEKQRAADQITEYWERLDSAISRVATELGRKGNASYPFALVEELGYLFDLRFKTRHEVSEYAPDVIRQIALEAYAAGRSAALETTDARVCSVSTEALAAIATSDHDCPGIHSNDE